jgi:TM2 domain-containing membrane protein YozV
MRKETGILLAGSLGLIFGLGFFGVRKFLLKKSKEYNDY